MHYFTSITTCYLPKARVLATTLKKYNPDAVMHLVVSDDLPVDFRKEEEPFDFVWYAEDLIKTEYPRKWFYLHTVVELCTAVKGAAALHILEQTGADKIVYLDPDIGVFSDLSPLERMLDSKSVLLTPHQVSPVSKERDILYDEICALKHGVYNFGFFAVRNDESGLRFLNWWNDRLMKFCYDDIPNGLFTDQKWGDLAPALFDFVGIIHDPGYNVATWNLATRHVEGNPEEGWTVNGVPLRFYHFTGYDSGAHRIMLQRHATEYDPVWRLSLMYEKMLNESGHETLGKAVYKYAFYENGQKITKAERLLFRSRLDLYKRFDNPFGDECCTWMKINVVDAESLEDVIKKYIKYRRLYKWTLFGLRRKYKSIYKRYASIIEKNKNLILQ